MKMNNRGLLFVIGAACVVAVSVFRAIATDDEGSPNTSTYAQTTGCDQLSDSQNGDSCKYRNVTVTICQGTTTSDCRSSTVYGNWNDATCTVTTTIGTVPSYSCR